MRPLLAALFFFSACGVRAAPVVNEVQSTNTSLPDRYGQFMDWVEIHNPTDAAISLQGYYLSDSTSNRLKFQFGDVTISAGGFLVVWCGQAGDFPTTGPYPPGEVRATTFNISSGGEPIVLTAPDAATTVDEFPAKAIGAGRTLGRGREGDFGTLFFYDSPTFGLANTTTGTPAVVPDPPVFSLPAGYYTQSEISVAISLPADVASGEIRYTLDGSEPTMDSPVYGAPLTLDNSTTTNTNSYIPTNFDPNPGWPYYEGWQPPASPPFRINVLRARVFAPGAAPGRVQTASYIQHPSGPARYTIPVVSVATDPANLFGNERGIYVPGWYNNMFQEGSAWERPGNIEFFEPDGSLAFSATIGLRLHGNTTRSRPRKSLRVYARNPYGESVFQHRIFPQKDVERFDTFLLRNGGNDWGNSLFRDALVTAMAAPTGLDIQASRPAAVFLSGEYWGIHNLRDRIDEGYFFHHYGLGSTSFSQIEVIPASDNSIVVADNGDPAGVADFQDLLDRASATGFADDADYAHLASRIDIDNYIDYNVFEIWSGNTDWPGNNYRLWRTMAADTSPGANPRHDGRWRWILFDTDFALGADFLYVPGHNPDVAAMAQFDSLAHATSTGGEFFSNKELATRLFRRALENTGFRNKFINRFADLLNTRLSAAHATAKLDEFVALYGPEVAEHVDRWRQPYDWSNDVVRMRGYMQARPAAVRGHIAGKFGLPGAAELTVDVDNVDRGSVQVNTVLVDPSTAGVPAGAYPWTGSYFQGVPITVTAVPKPGYRFVSWSKRTASTGTLVASDAALGYSSWTNGANGGNGFGPWSLSVSTGNADRAGTFLDNSRGGWGLYANSGETVRAERQFDSVLQAGQTFTARVKHGSVVEPGEVGFALANADGRVLFQLARLWSSPTYLINGATTDIPVTTTSLDIEVTLVTSNSYSARITTVGGVSSTNVGMLQADTDQAVRRFFAFNHSAGEGSIANVFVSSMQVGTLPGAGEYSEYSTNTTITPTLSGAAAFAAAFEAEPAMALAITPPVWTVGFNNAPVTVRAVNSLGDTDSAFNGSVTLTLTGPEGVIGSFSADAVGGVATFEAVDLDAGSYSLSAAAGELATAEPFALSVRAAATFLPAGDGVWHEAANWDAGAVPNGAAVSVVIPPNTSANRSVTNNAPTTIAAVTFELGTSAFRNRINGTAGQPLTLQSDNGLSTITVTGTGTGHANIDVPGGVTFSNDVVLDVQNTAAGNVEYGALRLQGNWSGAGRLIKRGAGMAGITGAGKTFAGDVIIEQGVLTFSEPAVSGNNVTSYTVQPGGQLRLSSAGNPRNYLFKGPLSLAGSGRTGVSEDENLGVLGALRLETGSTGNTAVLGNTVHLAASADIHVPAGNTIRLDGPLTTAANTNILTKSGGGTLALAATSSWFTGGLDVNRGTLHLDGALLTNAAGALTLGGQTALTGSGSWGGELHVQSGATLAADLGAAPASAPLRAGVVNVSGPSVVSLTMPSNAVPGMYPLVATAAGIAGASNLALSLPSSNFPYASLAVSNNTLYAVLSSNAHNFRQWAGDALWSSDSDGNGHIALAEFALGASSPGAPFAGPVMARTNQGGTNYLMLRANVRTSAVGLSVVGQSARSLAPGNSWSSEEVEMISSTPDSFSGFEERVYRTPADGAQKFLRLSIELEEQ